MIANQARCAQPILPLRLFADNERVGAYGGRFLFNGAVLSTFYFPTLPLQRVSGYTPLQAGLAFLPQTIAAFAVASAVPRLTRRIGTPLVAVIGVALMVMAMAWLSRLSSHTDYLTGIVLPMVLYGSAQGLVLSSLTTAGMTGVALEDAGAAGGLVNVAHHLGGVLGLGVLTTVFATATAPGAGPHELLAHPVAAAFTGATGLTLIALFATGLVARSARAHAPRRRRFGKANTAALNEPAHL